MTSGTSPRYNLRRLSRREVATWTAGTHGSEQIVQSSPQVRTYVEATQALEAGISREFIALEYPMSLMPRLMETMVLS
ncbi:hypothetical protein PM082_014404 [Marasmius tenuissimus]|nr:hypothetical protein PM082_014404 [Marasmius tenuissimus]